MLLTKLHIPPAGNNIVHRSELCEKLNTGLSRKLILVSAPAGYGKTTLLAIGSIKIKFQQYGFHSTMGIMIRQIFLSYVISGIKSIHQHSDKVPCVF